MNLLGKTREQIEKATKDCDRRQLVNLIYSLATLEPHFTPRQVAERRALSVDTILRKVRSGELPAHRPAEKQIRIPLSSVEAWDRHTALFFTSNGSDKSQ